MANIAIVPPNLLIEPGFLYWGPLLTAVTTNTATGGRYTDTWGSGWVPLGPTESGTDFSYTTTVSKIEIAESYDPVAYRTTGREGHFGFALASVTADNLVRALNGAVAVVTGTGGTKSTQITPVTPGNETRSMIGWESFDSTCRIIAYQIFNSGELKLSANKSPAKVTIPWMANFEIPAAGGAPWSIWTTR